MTYEENVKAILESVFSGYRDDLIDVALRNIISLTPPQGEWIEGDTDVYYDLLDYKCSLCGYISLENGNYCPNCGVSMIRKEQMNDNT